MVTLDATTRRRRGVTLVECRLESERERRVRVENRCDGPLWPPRRRGVPAAGWDADGVAVTVPADGRVGFGYATPAPPADPPAAVTESTPVSEDAEFETGFDLDATPAGVVRGLSDPRPPGDAVRPVGTDATGRNARDAFPATAPDGDPDDVEAWLRGVERRVERLEGVAGATTLPAATDEVAAVGGLDAVESLVATATADRERLLETARRAEVLAARVEAADPNLPALRRLA